MIFQYIYTITFLCLLKFNKVLRIQLKNIDVADRFKKAYQTDFVI